MLAGWNLGAGAAVLAGSARRLRGADPVLVALIVLTAAGYAAYALIRHAHFQTGLDLGIFDQAIWHYSRFEAPASSVNGLPNLLGDHFHPILVLIAPFYWVWSDARVLLIVQALAVVASTVPVFAFALPRLGRIGALLLAAAYISFWGLQSGVAFDFHEVAFAPLLIASAIWAIDLRRWWAFGIAVTLLLMVKEDLSIFVVFLGAYLLTLREFKAGASTCLAGVAWYELVVQVVIPHFSARGTFNYWTFTQLGKDLPDALGHILRRPWKPFVLALDHTEKVRTLVYLFAPFLGLTLCSRLALLTVPLLAERFLSTNPQFWGTSFHYSMAAAPALAMGAAAGLYNVARWGGPQRVRMITTIGAGTALVATIIINVAAVRPAPVLDVTDRAFYRDPAYAPPLRRALARIPSHASLTTQGALLPHLAHRENLREIDPRFGPTEYLLTNVVTPVGAPGAGGSYRAQQIPAAAALARDYPVYYEDGWVLARRRPSGAAGLHPSGLALAPLTKPRARRLLGLYVVWEKARVQAFVSLARCSALRLRRDASAPGCFAAIGADFRARESEVVSTLAGVTPTLQGGCRELAALSTGAVSRVARDFEAARAGGGATGRSQLIRAGQRLSRDTDGADLPGRFGRFLVLCSPP